MRRFDYSSLLGMGVLLLSTTAANIAMAQHLPGSMPYPPNQTERSGTGASGVGLLGEHMPRKSGEGTSGSQIANDLPQIIVDVNDQTPPKFTVEKIIIEGNQRIEPGTIRSYLGIAAGDKIAVSDVNKALKRLYATELFADIRMGIDGQNLQVKVKENPVINKIAFEGNNKLENEELQKEIQLRSRSVYTRSKVTEDAERIMQLYRRSGRFQAKVSPKIIQRDSNRVDVVFEIFEGDVTNIRGIQFIGNKIYTDRQLRKIIESEETVWYKFFSSSDKYDPDRVNYDKEKLRRHYVSNGYADFRVNSVVVELSPEDNGFYLTFSIDEGAHYHFGTIQTESVFADISSDALLEKALTQEGEEFNALLIEDSIDAMTDLLGDRGYAFARVSPDLERDTQNKLIHITYKSEEAPRVYVERINVDGNLRTADEVIRREFRLSEGDPFSTSKLKRSEERLKNLNFFEKVDISTAPGSAPDKATVNVKVSEKSTGELSLGAGYSTLDGALADIGLRENNFMGTGKQLRARAMLAQLRQEVDLGFTEPYFLGKEIAAGFDIFKITQDFRIQSNFDRRSDGGRLRAGYALTEYLTHQVSYTIREDEVLNVQPGASRFVVGQLGSYITSMVSHNLLYDKRDNRFMPTKGYFINFAQDFAGLGGDASYIRNEGRAAVYYSIYPQWILELGGSAGLIHEIGNNGVRINDRFFIGERQVRGFEQAGIGPRDIITRDALGGNRFYTGTVELGFPLLDDDDDLGLRGAVFTDISSLWNSGETGPEIVDSNSVRVTVGVGLAWASPFGPLRLDFGRAIVKETYDVNRLVRFSFGTQF